MNKILFLFLYSFSAGLLSCSNKVYMKTITSYLNASTVNDKSKFMADDYRSFFMEKKGDGEDKASALKSFQNWDGQMDPDIKILEHTVKDNTWIVKFNEQNDFCKLIRFPGWKGSMSFRFNTNGLIRETIYFPDSTNHSYKLWLQPAVDWLEKNAPDELSKVYRNKKLVQNEEAAKQWKILLKRWRDHDDAHPPSTFKVVPMIRKGHYSV